jgi:hypothetical protein
VQIVADAEGLLPFHYWPRRSLFCSMQAARRAIWLFQMGDEKRINLVRGETAIGLTVRDLQSC